MGNLIKTIDWGAPNYFLAIAVTILVVTIVIPTDKKKRKKGVSYAVLAGFGFIISGWVGLLTISITTAVGISSKLKGKKRYRAPLFSTIIFLTLSLFVVNYDPEASTEQRSGNFGGIWGGVVDFINKVGENAPKVTLFLTPIFLALVAFLMYRKYKKANVYKNMGINIDPKQMYNEVVNKDLKVLPESMRDPKRTFPPQMRAKKLKEQKGKCAYAHLSNHPKWEPYREGVQWEGDHIVPWAVGGATNPINLQMLCADCNSAKSSKMFKEAEKSVESMWKTKKANR